MKSIVECPKCQMEQYAVYNSRKQDNGIVVRHKRCCNCGHKIITYEIDKEDFEEMNRLPQNLTMFKDAMRFGIIIIKERRMESAQTKVYRSLQ